MKKTILSLSLLASLGLYAASLTIAQTPAAPKAPVAPVLPTFKHQTVDDKVQIGYGTAIGDVNGDGRPDILLADKKQFVWYQNPDWKKHILAENLTPLDNVCIAARDIDGDGKVEIAVGAQWNPGDTVGSGAVFYLIPPEDRTQPWTPVKLHHEPTTHRMAWVKLEDGKFNLVVSPLHGRGNKNNDGAGVKLLAYEMPADPREPWAVTTIEDSMHVTHNLDPVQWDTATPSEEILYLGKEGAMLLANDFGSWSKRKFPKIAGGGEIRMGLLAKNARPYIVTIEPFHGDKLVFYRSSHSRDAATVGGSLVEITERIVLDDDLADGHALATGDLLGNDAQQIVVGWRKPNRQGKVGLKLYYPLNPEASAFKSMVIDDNTMACEDLKIADLNGDGRLDIVAAGRATNNLKIYWNLGPEKK